jgi:hypothetical protein
MRVAIDGAGYASAVQAFVHANLAAADVGTRLAGRLTGYAAMAGDDATATDFADSYDSVAAASVAALADLVNAFGALAHLTETSLTNHARADADSTLPGWAARVTGLPTVADHSVGLRLAPPPTALGGDTPHLPGPVTWLLDQLQGIVWPNADTTRLRQAAATWREAGIAVGLLVDHCHTARDGLEHEQSPEVPLAVAATGRLSASIGPLADQLTSLGAACETYADQVDAHREQMLDLLEDLVEELAIGALIAGGLSLLSAGLAAPAAGATGSARLAWAASELKAIIDTLCLLAGGTATELRIATATVAETRGLLAPFLHLTEAHPTPGILPDTVPTPDPWQPGWLTTHEHSGSHTIEKHVGKTDEELAHRFIREPDRRLSSTFIDHATAERAIEQALRQKQDTVDAWLAGHGKQIVVQADMGEVVGRILVRDSGALLTSTRVRVLLIRDTSMPYGWRIKTAYPDL